MKFRKKPIIVEAIQWTGNNVEELNNFASGSSCFISFAYDRVYIETLEGTMYAISGDWVIKGIKNEVYPCNLDVFKATYEPLDPITIPESVFKDGLKAANKKAYKPSCVEDGCWWECVKCGNNSTSPFSSHKVTYRGPECDGVVIKRSSIRRMPVKDLGTLEFTDDD